MALVKKTASKKPLSKAADLTVKAKPTASVASRPTSASRRFPLSDVDRNKMIAELAYYKAERRNFTGGPAEQYSDWIEAEKEVSARFS